MTREWGDNEFDRRCGDEELDKAAADKNMTVAEYRDWCDEQNAEGAISRMESDQ
jgi:hypothetical protein